MICSKKTIFARNIDLFIKMNQTDNPWLTIKLSDYENHMSDNGVKQAQLLDHFMAKQLSLSPTVCILGIAGGNGLGNVNPTFDTEVYGIDINPSYLSESSKRYPDLNNIYRTICTDINESVKDLPNAEMVIANLFIEYVGYDNFCSAIKSIHPKIVSCVIQRDPADSFVSETPYAARLVMLDSVHSSIDRDILIANLGNIGYMLQDEEIELLSNKKELIMLTFINADTY